MCIPPDESHLGHAVLLSGMHVRGLEFQGYQVRLVQNFTDMDDKSLPGAKTGEEVLTIPMVCKNT